MNEADSSFPHPSPCVALCQLDEDGVCIGCRRTVREISSWSRLDEAQKAAVWQRLRALPRRTRLITCSNCSTRFPCGSGGEAGGCWCADLPPVAVTNAQDCLCPACLRQQPLA
ncbi:DUF1289 domain-containing protein [Chitinolyticbacter meiyuanensis]|uniref:DUF1289 domain-containing protein n=1 Tax=Chitinolyticbacter meiyuanensis TaxID=682798 RepID=UPI0011E5C865|nr:DUF1289 domain-containing protein [Chitinolyticbacter meiyuanensis]